MSYISFYLELIIYRSSEDKFEHGKQKQKELDILRKFPFFMMYRVVPKKRNPHKLS